MASHGRDYDHDALWAKLWELELQLTAYKLLHAAKCGEEDDDDTGVDGARETGSCCRGRQYDAYMRRRDARRLSAAAAEPQAKDQQQPRPPARGKPTPLNVKCAARDTPQVRRTLPAVPAPTTPRKEHAALPLARSRTVSSVGSPAARTQSHQRRSSVGGDFGDCATPRPFLRRGSGTGGATRHLQSPRVHDLPSSSPSPRRPSQDHLATKEAAGRHLRSVSEVPFHATAAAAMKSPRWAETPAPTQARARKRWSSLESPPPAIFSAAATNPHMDLAKGLRKLLSFVRKSKSSERQHGGGDGGRESGDGKPVKGWAEAAACSGLDGPLGRASLEGHRFPMTRAVGTSG